MNRLSSRMISLVLAALMLCSAAGISFFLLKGNIAFAADASLSVQSSVGYSYKEAINSETGIKSLVRGSRLYMIENGKSFWLELGIVDYNANISDFFEEKKDDDGNPVPDADGNPTYDTLKVKKEVLEKLDASLDPNIIRQLPYDGVDGAEKAYFDPETVKAVGGAGGVKYTIVFKNVKFTGEKGNIALDVTYPSGINGGGTTEFKLNALLPSTSSSTVDRPDNGKDDDDESSSSSPDIPPPTPTIIVSEYSYGGGNVTAASNFALTIKFKNTSQKLPIDNIVMKIALPEAFTITSSSNTFYIERMGKNAVEERTVNLAVKPNAEPISHPIKISYSFESVINETRKQYTADQEISIPVSQLDRFSLSPVEVPPELYVGEETPISVSFVNKGKTKVYNITAEITGNIAQPGQRQYIGDLDGGKEETADFLVAPVEGGTVNGEVVLTYEDANMNVYTIASPFTANATAFTPPPMRDDMVMNPDDMGIPILPWYQKIPVWACMVGGAVGLIFLAFMIKVMKARRAKLLEAQDEDF